MYQLRDGAGVRFTELLDILSAAYPEMRFRFTSPHPKDFPDDLLHLMADRPNICSQYVTEISAVEGGDLRGQEEEDRIELSRQK